MTATCSIQKFRRREKNKTLVKILGGRQHRTTPAGQILGGRDPCGVDAYDLATVDVCKMPAFMHCMSAIWPDKSVSSFLRQLTTWHCSRLRMLLKAGRVASDRCLQPAGPTAANPPRRRLNGGTIRRMDGRVDAMLCEQCRYLFYRLFAAILLNVTVFYR